MTERSMRESIVDIPTPATVMRRFYERICLDVSDELGWIIDPSSYIYDIDGIFSEDTLNQIKESVFNAADNSSIDDDLLQMLDAYESEITDSIDEHMDMLFKVQIKRQIKEFILAKSEK